MSTTLIPSKVPFDFYNQKKINFIKNEVNRLISKDFTDNTIVSDEDIKRILMRVLEERLEEDGKMTERTIMYIVDEIKAHHLDRLKHLNWEKVRNRIKGPYDIDAKSGPDLGLYKPSKQASTLRYYFSWGL
jgi:hypothetical protein